MNKKIFHNILFLLLLFSIIILFTFFPSFINYPLFINVIYVIYVNYYMYLWNESKHSHVDFYEMWMWLYSDCCCYFTHTFNSQFLWIRAMYIYPSCAALSIHLCKQFHCKFHYKSDDIPCVKGRNFLLPHKNENMMHGILKLFTSK